MATDGVNNNASTSFDLSKYENINKGTDAQVEQNISIFTKDVEQFVNDAWSSGGGMDDKETDIIFNCLKKMDEVFSSLSQSLKTKLEASVKNLFLFVLKENGMSNNYTSDSGNIKYRNGELTINDSKSQETKEYVEEASLEPTETDSQSDIDSVTKYVNDAEKYGEEIFTNNKNLSTYEQAEMLYERVRELNNDHTADMEGTQYTDFMKEAGTRQIENTAKKLGKARKANRRTEEEHQAYLNVVLPQNEQTRNNHTNHISHKRR